MKPELVIDLLLYQYHNFSYPKRVRPEGFIGFEGSKFLENATIKDKDTIIKVYDFMIVNGYRNHVPSLDLFNLKLTLEDKDLLKQAIKIDYTLYNRTVKGKRVLPKNLLIDEEIAMAVLEAKPIYQNDGLDKVYKTIPKKLRDDPKFLLKVEAMDFAENKCFAYCENDFKEYKAELIELVKKPRHQDLDRLPAWTRDDPEILIEAYRADPYITPLTFKKSGKLYDFIKDYIYKTGPNKDKKFNNIHEAHSFINKETIRLLEDIIYIQKHEGIKAWESNINLDRMKKIISDKIKLEELIPQKTIEGLSNIINKEQRDIGIAKANQKPKGFKI